MDDILGFGLPGLFFRLLSGAIIGFSIGLTGVGGGVLILPTLTILFGMDTTVAVGTASLYSFITRVTGTFHHYKLKTIKLAVAIWVLVGAIPANIAASWFVAATVRRLGAGSAAVEGRFRGIHVGDFAGVPGTGKAIDVPLAVFYTVEDRGITEGRVWFMLSTFLQQVS